MPYREFDGQLDSDDKKPASGFVPFEGELDAPAAKKVRTWGQAAADTGAQLGEGVNNILGAIPSLVAPESKAAQFFDRGANYWRDQQSDVIKERSAAADQAITAAGADGMAAQISEAASQYFSDPALAARFVTTNLPSMIPGIAAAKVAQVAALARGATVARAAAAATTAAGGANAVLNAGGARGEAFKDIKNTLVKQGVSPEKAEEQAIKDSRVVAAIGGAAGFISGKTGLEGAIAGRAATGAAVRRGAGAVASEMAGEQLEEVAPKLATNYQAGQYDGRKLGQDVGRTMVETAIGAGPGAVVGGITAARTPHAQPSADPSPATPGTPAPAAGPAPARREPTLGDVTGAASVDDAIAAADALIHSEAAPSTSPFASAADIDALERSAGMSAPAPELEGIDLTADLPADPDAPRVWRKGSDDGRIPTLTDAIGPQVWRRAPDIPTLTDVIGKPHEIPELTDIIRRDGIPVLTDVIAPADGIPVLNDVINPQPKTGGMPDGRIRNVGLEGDANPAPVGGGVELRGKTVQEPGAGGSGLPGLPASSAGNAVPAANESADASPALTPQRDAIDAIVNHDEDWHAFPAETGTLSIPRSEMPQIKAEHRGALTQFLKARGIAHEQIEVPAEDLKPTQAEFSLAKVQKAIEFTGGDRSILVSSDGHVLDGHHQWMAALDAGQPVKAIRLDAPIAQLLEQVREFPSTGVSEGAPTQEGNADVSQRQEVRQEAQATDGAQAAPQTADDPASAADPAGAAAPVRPVSKLEAARVKHQKQDDAVAQAAANIAARAEAVTKERAQIESKRKKAPPDKPTGKASDALPNPQPAGDRAVGGQTQETADAPAPQSPGGATRADEGALSTESDPDRDDGADIPLAFFKKVKVDHDVWIEDEGVMETIKVPANEALASVREDITNLRALLKCMKG